MIQQEARHRSWMFVPGDRQHMVEKSLTLSVDAVILDLEDGVATVAKDNARNIIADALNQVAMQLKQNAAMRTPSRYVRVNSVGHERMYEDISAVVRPGLQGLVLPKVESPDQVQLVDELLERAEADAHMHPHDVRLMLMIETPAALLNAFAIAKSSLRNSSLIFGGEDFSRELGMPLRREAESRDLIYARSTIVTVAVAAQLQPVDAVWTDLKDMEGLKRFAEQSRRLGFTGMSVTHPSQIDTVNAAFTPTQEELDYCRRVVEAYDEANARGAGALSYDGRLVDSPIVERARQTLALAESYRD